MQLARWPDSHVNYLTRERDADSRVAPLQGPAVILAHFLKERGLSRVLTVAQDAVPDALEGNYEAPVDGCGACDPLVIGARKRGRVIEPIPHYEARRGGEDQGIGQAGCEVVEGLCRFASRRGANGPAAGPDLSYQHI